MTEHTKKCKLGFNEDRILIITKKSSKRLEFIMGAVPTSRMVHDSRMRCTNKPKLEKSDREDLGYHYKKGKLYNLNYSEVPACIFCSHYR